VVKVKDELEGTCNTQTNLMYVWPCIIYENDERYQIDATTM